MSVRYRAENAGYIDQPGLERIDRPGSRVAHRHHVGVAGEAEVGRRVAEPCVEVIDPRLALAEGQSVAGEAEPVERRRQHVERARVGGRHAGAPNRVAGLDTTGPN